MGVRYKTILFFYLSFVFSSFAQKNLVPNGDFEEYDFVNAWSNPGWYSFDSYKGLAKWYSPVINQLWYFNPFLGFFSNEIRQNEYDKKFNFNEEYSYQKRKYKQGVPLNRLGFQYAKSGNSYMVLNFLWYRRDNALLFDNRRDMRSYATIRLSEALKVDSLYYVGLNIALCNVSNSTLKNIAFYFTKDSINFYKPNLFLQESKNYNFLPDTCIPQVVFTNENSYSDTANWTLLVKAFKASSEYNFLTIGFFEKDFDKYVLKRNDDIASRYWPQYDKQKINGKEAINIYYYIDDVFVYEEKNVPDEIKKSCLKE